MALGATIYKVQLSVADLDRGYYADHALILARHPSETEQRLMLRLLAFALQAGPDLKLGRGLSAEDEPDLFIAEPTGEMRLWIELGLPEEKRLRRACGRAQRVQLFVYGENKAQIWWQRNGAACRRLTNLEVLRVDDEPLRALAAMAERNMHLSVTIQEGECLCSTDSADVRLQAVVLQAATR